MFCRKILYSFLHYIKNMRMETIKKQLALRREKALSLLPSARSICLEYFQQDIKIREKSDGSPVTIADEKTELFFRDAIQKSFPHDSIIGEEGPKDSVGEEFTWTFDPIDGTASFVKGHPCFGILVGLLFRGVPIFGVADFPAINETIYALKGEGAHWKRGHQQHFSPCSVNSYPKIDQALVCCSGLSYFQRTGTESTLHTLQSMGIELRTWGDCYGAIMVATGRAEIYVEPSVHIWDLIPIQIITQEANGDFFDLEGKQSIHSHSLVTCNSQLGPPLKNILKQASLP